MSHIARLARRLAPSQSTSSTLALVSALALVVGGCFDAEPDRATPADESAQPASESAHGQRVVPDDVNIAKARAEGRAQAFEWTPWSAEAFERARAEDKFILLHCAAVWCHWCHVMEETTYLDPEIGRILREKFVAIRVDIDQRPDIEERYAAWGWPATVLFSPQAEELGKYRGYLRPDEMREILTTLESAGEGAEAGAGAGDKIEPGPRSAPVAALPWVGERTTMDMDRQYDAEQGGWGQRFKVPFGENAEMELRRAARGDDRARRRALFTLRRFARLIDPVWGGIYQYSTDGDWDHAHFEKLMIFQTPNLEAFARAYAVTGDADMLGHARAIADYVDAFLTSPEGTFYVTQDADVGTHDKSHAFVDGHDYYALGDAERRAKGIPWVDEHVYGFENGLMIAALVTLHEVTDGAGDGASDSDKDSGRPYLARARRAADAILASHVDERGAVAHDPKSASKVYFLADFAGFGRALARLAQVTGEARYRDAARRVADAMIQTLLDRETGAFWAHTPDPAAVGVFAQRRHAFAYNALAARFLVAVAQITGEKAYAERARAALAAIATPAAIAKQHRMLGGFLMALDDAGAYRW